MPADFDFVAGERHKNVSVTEEMHYLKIEE